MSGTDEADTDPAGDVPKGMAGAVRPSVAAFHATWAAGLTREVPPEACRAHANMLRSLAEMVDARDAAIVDMAEDLARLRRQLDEARAAHTATLRATVEESDRGRGRLWEMAPGIVLLLCLTALLMWFSA